MFGNFRVSYFLQSEEEGQCGLCVVSSFAPRPLSLSLTQSWSSGLQSVVCLLLICPVVEKFVFYIIFLFWSDQIGFSLFFYRKGHGLAEKLLLIIIFFIFLFVYYFLFLTNFVDISLCADPMRRNPFFSILMKVSAPITPGERSHGRLLQSLFCVYDKLERDLFR